MWIEEVRKCKANRKLWEKSQKVVTLSAAEYLKGLKVILSKKFCFDFQKQPEEPNMMPEKSWFASMKMILRLGSARRDRWAQFKTLSVRQSERERRVWLKWRKLSMNNKKLKLSWMSLILLQKNPLRKKRISRSSTILPDLLIVFAISTLILLETNF